MQQFKALRQLPTAAGLLGSSGLTAQFDSVIHKTANLNIVP